MFFRVSSNNWGKMWTTMQLPRNTRCRWFLTVSFFLFFFRSPFAFMLMGRGSAASTWLSLETARSGESVAGLVGARFELGEMQKTTLTGYCKPFTGYLQVKVIANRLTGFPHIPSSNLARFVDSFFPTTGSQCLGNIFEALVLGCLEKRSQCLCRPMLMNFGFRFGILFCIIILHEFWIQFYVRVITVQYPKLFKTFRNFTFFVWFMFGFDL